MKSYLCEFAMRNRLGIDTALEVPCCSKQTMRLSDHTCHKKDLSFRMYHISCSNEFKRVIAGWRMECVDFRPCGCLISYGTHLILVDHAGNQMPRFEVMQIDGTIFFSTINERPSLIIDGTFCQYQYTNMQAYHRGIFVPQHG